MLPVLDAESVTVAIAGAGAGVPARRGVRGTEPRIEGRLVRAFGPTALTPCPEGCRVSGKSI